MGREAWDHILGYATHRRCVSLKPPLPIKESRWHLKSLSKRQTSRRMHDIGKRSLTHRRHFVPGLTRPCHLD